MLVPKHSKQSRRNLLRSHLMFFCVLVLCFFCIRQHDVNILRTEKLEKRRDVCVLRFFSSTLLKLLQGSQNNNNFTRGSETTCVLFCCFGFYYFCRRQHDVNILTQSFLEKRRDVCVLRFFSSFSSSCSASSQPTS